MRALLATLGLLALTVPALAQTAPPTPSATGAPSAVAVPPAAETPPVLFQLQTTRDLVSLCSTPESDPNYPAAIGLCVGFGTGVIDYHLLDTTGRNARARRVCLPNPPPSRGDTRKLFVAWADANQTYMDEPAANGVMRFLIATYPCKR